MAAALLHELSIQSLIYAVLLGTLLLGGCASLSQAQAEDIALSFVSQRVRFYTSEENVTATVQQYNREVLESYKVDSGWYVLVHVWSAAGNTSKQARMSVVVDSTGKVQSFSPKA
jgi:hypothetical protein